MQQIVNILDQMKTNTLTNYILAGVSSSLVNNGSVRYFEASRNQRDSVTPHSHRFDFTCLVLKGFVKNEIWSKDPIGLGDEFEESQIFYNGEVGCHDLINPGDSERGFYTRTSSKYTAGHCYSMTSDQIHSIVFSKEAKVLFFEGPQLTKTSRIIQPVVDGEVIRTYRKLDYMFKALKKESENA